MTSNEVTTIEAMRKNAWFWTLMHLHAHPFLAAKSATCNASCLVLNIPFKEQKPTLTLFGEYSTCCFAKKHKSRPREDISFVEEFFPQITIYRNRTWTEEGQNHSVWCLNTVSTHWLRNWASFSTFDSFHKISTYIQATLSSQFSKKNPVDSWLWSRLCHSDCRRSRTRNDIKFPGISSACLETADVPKTRVFGQSFGRIPNHSKPTTIKVDLKWGRLSSGYRY